MADKKLIKINLSEIIRSRLGERRAKIVPGFLLRGLERLIRQDDLNAMLEYAYPAEGSGFASKILDYLGIDITIDGLHHLSHDELFEFASNHPLGGLDGIALVSILGKRYGDENIGVVVNDLLMHVSPLADVFLPVNKYGAQARRSATLINDAFEGGRQIVMFPAGLVSRLDNKGEIHDLEWQKSFVVKAIEHHRRIIPIRFEARNSMRFYRTALWRKRIGLKLNIEQSLLPAEVVRSRGAAFHVKFFPPVDVVRLHSEGKSPALIANAIRKIVEGV